MAHDIYVSLSVIPLFLRMDPRFLMLVSVIPPFLRMGFRFVMLVSVILPFLRMSFLLWDLTEGSDSYRNAPDCAIF